MNAGVKHNIYNCGNAVDVKYVRAFAPSQKIKKYDACFVGNIDARKGIFDLIKAWKYVTKLKGGKKLVIIGFGKDFWNCQKLIKDLKLTESIILFGAVDDKTLFRTLFASKIFVFPSYIEGWGLAIVEALSCGLPVICYNLPTITEVVDNCDAVLLVEKGNIKKFAKAILKLLEDEQYRKELEFKAVSYAKNFSWDKVAYKEISILRAFIKPLRTHSKKSSAAKR